MNPEPKISLPEIYLLVIFAVLADLINWIPYVNILVTVITLPAFQLYFILKGVRGIYSLSGQLLEFIPFLSILPGITAGVIATIMIDRSGITKVLDKASPVKKLKVKLKPGLK